LLIYTEKKKYELVLAYTHTAPAFDVKKGVYAPNYPYTNRQTNEGEKKETALISTAVIHFSFSLSLLLFLRMCNIAPK